MTDELAVATLWLSLQLDHRLPVTVLRRGLVLHGLNQTGHVLTELRAAVGSDGGS